MRLLFVKTSLAWPRASGHDVYTYYTMKACAELGHDVFLATADEPAPEAIAGLRLAGRFLLADDAGHGQQAEPVGAVPIPAPGTWLQRRFRSFWGVGEGMLAGLRRVIADSRPDAVIVVGLDALPYFPSLANVVRVWYPADEWVWHHLSQVRVTDRSTWHHVKSAAIKGLYERAHRRAIDRVWVVSDQEKKAMRWFGGMRHVDVLPLGVDSEFFRPGAQPDDRTAIFWGRLDFGPNVQAIEWFAHHVWPIVRRDAPDARFTIVGFNPGPEVTRLESVDGITVKANVPDLRDIARRHAMVVLPLVSGGGMKNKLLEAAALGLPIVCTPLATQGLRGLAHAPFAVATQPREFARAMLDLWNDADKRRRVAARTREWVLEHHSWESTGQRAIAAVRASVAGVAP